MDARISAKKFWGLTGYQWTCILYIAVAIFCWQLKYFRHIDNNYIIFRTSFYHFRDHLNLYLLYPAEYYDVYIYGPLFTVFIAPLSLMPEWLGFLLWEVGNAAAFLWAIHLLPFSNKTKTIILLLCAIEFANSSHYMQFNPIIAAIVILSFVMVKRQKEQYATLFTIAGTLMKIYPVVGLAFFFFSKNKAKYILWSVIWLVVLICLPAIISGPGFLIQTYKDWFAALTSKNLTNQSLTTGFDWCVMGMVRRFFQDSTIPNWPFLLMGALSVAGALLRVKQYPYLKFQLQLMCSLLMMIVLFSTASEHPTFIIATAGAVIYIMMQPKPFTAFNIVMLVLLLLVTGLGPSDAFPKPARIWMQNYAIKAYAPAIIWFKLAWELLFADFSKDQY
ncbi:glycosyltransferase family 87 protein [Mucilaginibacter sp. MD40]|uniref:glycosyltransferase family 87 protein n=1 Tax=Mucilaginibacter sp. MD40 TaxID=2029590 RepID=UPI0013042BA1|nr:glycosyltransferase family 87 protein [Mucilaginibacter sp. MD40]